MVENNQLVYNDGVMKFFLYTEGEYGGSDSLKSLLRYMTLQDMIDFEKEESYMAGKEDGIEEGRTEGIFAVIRICCKVGLSPEETKDILIKEYSLDADEAEKRINDYNCSIEK